MINKQSTYYNPIRNPITKLFYERLSRTPNAPIKTFKSLTNIRKDYQENSIEMYKPARTRTNPYEFPHQPEKSITQCSRNERIIRIKFQDNHKNNIKHTKFQKRDNQENLVSLIIRNPTNWIMTKILQNWHTKSMKNKKMRIWSVRKERNYRRNWVPSSDEAGKSQRKKKNGAGSSDVWWSRTRTHDRNFSSFFFSLF